MDDDTLKTFAYVTISSYRERAVRALQDENKTPTQIANDSDIRVNHISKVLKELKECGVAECINEEKRKNRIYRLTNVGQDIVDKLEDE
jgi:predicted transcriptional regulator